MNPSPQPDPPVLSAAGVPPDQTNDTAGLGAMGPSPAVRTAAARILALLDTAPGPVSAAQLRHDTAITEGIGRRAFGLLAAQRWAASSRQAPRGVERHDGPDRRHRYWTITQVGRAQVAHWRAAGLVDQTPTDHMLRVLALLSPAGRRLHDSELSRALGLAAHRALRVLEPLVAAGLLRCLTELPVNRHAHEDGCWYEITETGRGYYATLLADRMTTAPPAE